MRSVGNYGGAEFLLKVRFQKSIELESQTIQIVNDSLGTIFIVQKNKVFLQSFNIKCMDVVCKHYSSYLRNNDASDDYSERYNKGLL